MLTNKSLLITGGTGSFGNAFVPLTLRRFNPRRLVIYSRDEMKQWEMAKRFKSDERVRFFLDNLTEAAAPSNVPLVNPASAKAAIDTAGGSLLRGGGHFLRDMASRPRVPARQVEYL